jgi:hypothetical protein
MEEAATELSRFVVFYYPRTVLSIVGGLLIWVGFALAGLISRKHEISSGQGTNWQLMVLAPSGILLCTIWQGAAYLLRGDLTVTEHWMYYALVIPSALLCVREARSFRRLALQISRGLE